MTHLRSVSALWTLAVGTWRGRPRRPEARWRPGAGTLALVLALLAGSPARSAADAVIFVTTLEQKVDASIPGCSLQEAIYSANFDANTAIVYGSNSSTTIVTECVPGSDNDVIVLPTRGVLPMSTVLNDGGNPYGPTATPLVTSTIVIDGHGATLQRTGNAFFRAFAVGIDGHLTIRSTHLTGFLVHGGNGGPAAGGGMGAGGAVYVHAGGLVIEASTFSGNGALGGDGSGGSIGGGGGGLGGHGRPDGDYVVCQGGIGGGGSRGNGGSACGGSITVRIGGGGGGTLARAGGGTLGGLACGGNGGRGGQRRWQRWCLPWRRGRRRRHEHGDRQRQRRARELRWGRRRWLRRRR